jgi:hypothetical protein
VRLNIIVGILNDSKKIRVIFLINNFLLQNRIPLSNALNPKQNEIEKKNFENVYFVKARGAQIRS